MISLRTNSKKGYVIDKNYYSNCEWDGNGNSKVQTHFTQEGSTKISRKKLRKLEIKVFWGRRSTSKLLQIIQKFLVIMATWK